MHPDLEKIQKLRNSEQLQQDCLLAHIYQSLAMQF